MIQNPDPRSPNPEPRSPNPEPQPPSSCPVDRSTINYCDCPYPRCDGRIPCYPHSGGLFYCTCPERNPVRVTWADGKAIVSRS